MRSLLIGFALFSGIVLGADINGVWLGQMKGKNGTSQDIAFQFVLNGTTLSGKMYGDYHSTPISEGRISGDLITFVLNAEEQAGNQINESRIRYSGKVSGSEMELFRDRETSKNAGNGGAVQIKSGEKQVCHLKRLP